MTKFSACNPCDAKQTCCIFSDRSFQRLPEDQASGLARCIRHNALVDDYREADTIEEARKQERKRSRKVANLD